MAGTSSGSAGLIRLQSGQGAPAPPHLHALSPRNGRSTWSSQTHRQLSHREQYFILAYHHGVSPAALEVFAPPTNLRRDGCGIVPNAHYALRRSYRNFAPGRSLNPARPRKLSVVGTGPSAVSYSYPAGGPTRRGSKRIHHPAESRMAPVLHLDPAVETTGAIGAVAVLGD